MTQNNTQQNNEKGSEKALNHEFTDVDRQKALESPNNGKRGKGKVTIFRDLIQSAESTNEVQELVKSVIAGKLGEDSQIKLALAAADVGFRQMLIDYKRESDIEKAHAISEINNDVNAKLVAGMITRLTKDASPEEAKAMIRKVRHGE